MLSAAPRSRHEKRHTPNTKTIDALVQGHGVAIEQTLNPNCGRGRRGRIHRPGRAATLNEVKAEKMPEVASPL